MIDNTTLIKILEISALKACYRAATEASDD